MALALVTIAAAPLGAQEAAPEPPACREQTPLPFMIRGAWQVRARMPREEIAERRALAAQAVRFRTEQYGYFDGFGDPSWNATAPLDHAISTRFFGLRVRLHERIVPALQCVERALTTACASESYRPRRASGIRDRNTYHNGEVSNHVYGIAIDLDPNENTCCGCVPPWNEHPACGVEASTLFERMRMPECWVREFERYGFYWLGRDALQDTMHFEFAADPSRILDTTTPSEARPEPLPYPAPIAPPRARAARPRARRR